VCRYQQLAAERSRSKSRVSDPGDPSNAEPLKPHRVRASMYNFGSPKVGNGVFAKDFNKLIPDSFRVVVDGDPVTGVPPGYSHVGTEILIDDTSAGSIIIDPSFVERWLRTKYKTSVASHNLLRYRDSLLGVVEAANFMHSIADNALTVDTVKLALQTRNLLKEERKRGNTMRGSFASPPVSPTDQDRAEAAERDESKTQELRYAAEFEQNSSWLANVGTPVPTVSTKIFSTSFLPVPMRSARAASDAEWNDTAL
jgi:hypothetical protein